jgi:AhpD family alkylhydroperoxidase
VECPAEKMKKDEGYGRVMLIAAGSAMAASCEPCLNTVIPNLIEIGVPENEIRKAVEIGQYVKDRQADIMKEAADVLAGTHFLDEQVPEECAREETGTPAFDKLGMLIAVGASVAGNCENCLNTVVLELRSAGVTNEEIRAAVMIGQTVKEKPAGIIKEAADKLTGAPPSSLDHSEGYQEPSERPAPSCSRQTAGFDVRAETGGAPG